MEPNPSAPMTQSVWNALPRDSGISIWKTSITDKFLRVLIMSAILSSASLAAEVVPHMNTEAERIKVYKEMDMKMNNIQAIEIMPRDKCEYQNEFRERWVGSVFAFAAAFTGAAIVRNTGGSEGWVRTSAGIGLLGGYKGGYYGYKRWGRDCAYQKGDPNWRYGTTLIECKAKGQNILWFWSIAGGSLGFYVGAGKFERGNPSISNILGCLLGTLLGMGSGAIIGGCIVAPCGFYW